MYQFSNSFHGGVLAGGCLRYEEKNTLFGRWVKGVKQIVMVKAVPHGIHWKVPGTETFMPSYAASTSCFIAQTRSPRTCDINCTGRNQTDAAEPRLISISWRVICGFPQDCAKSTEMIKYCNSATRQIQLCCSYQKTAAVLLDSIIDAAFWYSQYN